MSKCIKLVACVILAMIFFPAAVLAEGEPVCVNTTTGTEYSTIVEALAEVSSGQTIELLQDMIHTDENTIQIYGTYFTLNLNGHILSIISTSGTALEVYNSRISLTDTTGRGEFNVTGKTTGVSIMGSNGRSEVTVTNATATGSDGCGAYAYGDVSLLVEGDVTAPFYGVMAGTNSVVTVLGDCSGGYSAVANSGGEIYVYGNVITDRYFGVIAEYAGSKVVVKGDCIATGDNYPHAASAYKGEVIIEGDVYSYGGTGVSASANGELFVKGNVFAETCGAIVQTGGRITVNGIINVPSNSSYVFIDGETKGQEDDYTPTTKPGYRTYKNPSGPTSTVWVKYVPNIVSVSATPDSISFSGGLSTFVLAGDLLFDGIRATAFSADTVTAITAVTTGDIHTQTTSLTFPSNTSTTADKEYVIKFSSDDGQTWLPETISITVAKTIRHTVTFDSQGGSAIESMEKTYLSPYGNLPTPSFTGYTFTGWYTDSGGTGTRITSATIMTMTDDHMLYAGWRANTYTIVYDKNSGESGYTANTSHVYDASKALTANGYSRAGYTFAGWATSTTGFVEYEDSQNVLNLTAVNGATVTLYAQWTPHCYTVVYDKNDGDGGSTASSNHVYGIYQTLTANGFTKTGYSFVGWATSAIGPVEYEDSQSVRNLTTTNGATVTLYAKWNVNQYAITATVNNAIYGSVSGGGSFDYGTLVTVNATPKTGYRFVRWLEDSIAVSTNANYTFTVTKSRMLKAEFEPISYAVVVSNNSTAYGSVSGGGSFDYGTLVTVNATPKTGYRFVRWLEGSIAVSTNANYTFTVTKSRMLKAEFEPISYTVVVSTNSTAYGSVSGGGNFEYGTLVTVNATPKTGYRFVRWHENSIVVTTNASYTFTVTKARMLKAEFEPISYAVAVSTNSTAYGSVSGGGSFDYGTSVTVNATPKSGCRFVCWLEGSIVVSTNASYTFTVTKPRTLKAEFIQIGTPTVKAAAASYNSIKVTWGAVNGASGCEVWCSTTAGSGYTLAVTTAATSYTNTGLATGTTYYYKIRAYRTVSGIRHYSGFSAVVSAKPVPATPTGAKATAASYNSIKVTWSAAGGAGGYEVWRSTSSGSGFMLVGSESGTSYTNSLVATGTTYYYKIRAYCSVGGTRVYGPYSTVVSARTVPATPAAPKATAVSYNSVKLTWSAAAGAGGYEVWRSTGSGYTLAGTVAGTSSTSTGLSTGTTYYYKIRAYRTVNGSKVYGGYSSVVSARTVPATPAGAKATVVSYNSARVTWSAASGAGGYEVWRSTSSASGYKLAAAISTTSYTNTGLATGTTYYYKIRAYRTVSGVRVYGSYSAVVSTKPVLSAATGLKAARVSATSIRLTWYAVAGVTKYEVYRAASASGTYTKLTEVTSAAYTGTGLTTGKTYYYKVRAYRLVAGKKVYGGYSAVVSAKP